MATINEVGSEKDRLAAITDVSIEPKYNYSQSAAGAVVLTPEGRKVKLTYRVTVTVDPASSNHTGTLQISDLTTGATPIRNPVPLTANGVTPYADVTFHLDPDNATHFNFAVTPTLDDGTPGNKKLAYMPYPLPIAWVGAGLLYPTLEGGQTDPDDVPVLDTSDPMAAATITVKLTDNKTNRPLQGVAVLFGPPEMSMTISDYQFNDAFGTGAPLTVDSTIPSRNTPAISVVTDANGQAGIKMSIDPDNAAVSAQSQLITWGAQVEGGLDASYFFSDQDRLFVGPLTSDQSFTMAPPTIAEAVGQLSYDPQNAATCTLEMTAAWNMPQALDHIAIVVGDDESGRLRDVLTVSQCDYVAPLNDKSRLTYSMDIHKLITGLCPLRFEAFRGTNGLSGTTFSGYDPYTIGKLPPVAPPNVNRVGPVPRLFYKTIDLTTGQAAIGGEIDPNQNPTITWDYIKYGGIYVFIPYASTNGASGMNGSAFIKMYKTGVYKGQPVQSTVATRYRVDVADVVVSPQTSPTPLANGLLYLIPLQDLRYWNRLPNGFPGPCYVEYYDASSSFYSQLWTGFIDTMPIQL